MLRLELIGNLGSDPELRYTAAGRELLSFRVAINSVKGKDDARQERTDWFRVMVSGGRARYLNEALRKGSRVLAIGRYEIGEWTTREGEVKTSFDLWADEVVNLTPRDQRDTAMPAGVGAARASGESTGPTELEDLPF